jgi:hypothetical protein
MKAAFPNSSQQQPVPRQDLSLLRSFAQEWFSAFFSCSRFLIHSNFHRLFRFSTKKRLTLPLNSCKVKHARKRYIPR